MEEKKVMISKEEIRYLEKILNVLKRIAGKRSERIRYRTRKVTKKLPECPQLILYRGQVIEVFKEKGGKKRIRVLLSTKILQLNPETALRDIKQKVIRARAVANIIIEGDLDSD
ncbi:MAG: hypothetical protein NTW06_01600 [Candidatus Falkowbacteria bacterium]|jgi:hypothetical protein|nr:hypothetical protein [Candidatus Falkowbacteria bacterium]